MGTQTKPQLYDQNTYLDEICHLYCCLTPTKAICGLECPDGHEPLTTEEWDASPQCAVCADLDKDGTGCPFFGRCPDEH